MLQLFKIIKPNGKFLGYFYNFACNESVLKIKFYKAIREEYSESINGFILKSIEINFKYFWKKM